MKKLESIISEKFKISESQLTKINGGVNEAADDSSWDGSYNIAYTQTDSGYVLDQTLYDICRDF